MLPHDKIFVENKNNFFQKTIDKVIKEKNINIKDFSKKTCIPYDRLIDCRRLRGRRKSIRLDYFLKVFKFAGIPEKDYINYMKCLKSNAQHRKSLPLKLTKELRWLAGIIATDGCIVRSFPPKSENQYYKIKIGNKSQIMIDKARSILNRLGFP